jgi:hypothetical protein
MLTYEQACRVAFDRAGLWHWVGEARRLAHFARTGRWVPPLERVPVTVTGPVPDDRTWEAYG